MKNSTLLRLFFVSIGLPLTCASSSPSTSSALIPKTKRKPVSPLMDTTNNVEPVQLKDQGILAQGVSEEGQVSEKDEQIKRFEELVSEKEHRKFAGLGNESDKELLECLCQMVTSLDQFKGLYGYLEQHGMVPDFLAHGEMVLVRKVIVERDLLETDRDSGECDSLYDAVALSLREDRHERVAGLFEAAHKRPKWKNRFPEFVRYFFKRYPPEKDSMPLKRFLTLQGEEFSKQYPEMFENICQGLVVRLILRLGNPASQKLLIDLTGQPSLLTPAAFAGGFLYVTDDTDRTNIIKYGYKEAIEEGLKGEYEYGGRKLWAVMVSKYPNRFSGKYPSSDKARAVALKDLPIKQDLEEAWAKKNAPILLKHLEMLVTELPLYRDLLSIVAEYAITWIIV